MFISDPTHPHSFCSSPRGGALAAVLVTAIAVLSALPAKPVWAKSGQDSSLSLDQVVQTMRQQRQAVSRENKKRVRRFLRERNKQRGRLKRIRQKVKEAKKKAGQMEDERNDNERKLKQLKSQLDKRKGGLSELFGAARSAAAKLNKNIKDSLISSQFPGRSNALETIAHSDRLPTIKQLQTLWYTYLQQANEQSKVVRFDATVIGTDNKPAQRKVTREGPFTAFSNDGDFLRFDNGKLRFLARQPGGGANRAARRVANYSGDGFVAGAIDPSLGTLLSQVVEAPTVRERIKQGGNIGYIIIAITIAGVLLALYRLCALLVISIKVRAQTRQETPSKRNPLGRVMKAYGDNSGGDIETLQLKLDDAVLGEVPKLERGLNIVRVLAAVTPLLGLLGTVIGMILTFQAITLFGTGNPQLMAGGISQALVTTVLGLIGAIPLLLLHAFASGASRRVAQVLEEQSAGMIAETAEKRN